MVPGLPGALLFLREGRNLDFMPNFENHCASQVKLICGLLVCNSEWDEGCSGKSSADICLLPTPKVLLEGPWAS